MNAAFLVERGRLDEFSHRCAARFRTSSARRMRLRCVGPLPPYSFADDNVSELASWVSSLVFRRCPGPVRGTAWIAECTVMRLLSSLMARKLIEVQLHPARGALHAAGEKILCMRQL